MRSCDPILLVDDDTEFRQGLIAEFRGKAAWPVIEAGSVAEASRFIQQAGGRFEAVLLDAELPDGRGADLCRTIRKHHVSLPVLLLTGPDEGEIVNGFEAGATDVVCKPVRTAELLARLRAHRRSLRGSIDSAIPIGRYVFRPSMRTLMDTERRQRVWLTAKEAGILQCLHDAAGSAVNRETLLHAVWGLAANSTTHTLETHIYRLRQKLGDQGLLHTGKGGYSLGLTQDASD